MYNLPENYGFVKVAAVVPFGKVAAVQHNTQQIISLATEAAEKGAQIIVFPELTLTGYTCGDLFHQHTLQNACLKAIEEICVYAHLYNTLLVFGAPIVNRNKLFNCAVVVNQCRVLGIVPKSFIPGYKEFYEPRWFSGNETEYDDNIDIKGYNVPFGTNLLFRNSTLRECIVGIEICEDMWVPIPPSCYHTLAGATIICNLSASNALVAKSEYRRELIRNQSGRCVSGYIYASAGMGESTTDVVFDADAMIAENGAILADSQRFKRENQIIYSEIDVERLKVERAKLTSFRNEGKNYQTINFSTQLAEVSLTRYIEPNPFVPKDKEKLDLRCQEIFNIQAAGLAKRLETIPNVKAVIGISGGLDSTLALLVVLKAFQLTNKKTEDIVTVTMPGFGTTGRTYQNALILCKSTGTTFKEIGIKEVSQLMLDTIGHEKDKHDITYENIQARARTYILMTVANQVGGIVIGTGDLSEIALGWCTYNGDHISMYNVNSSIPKTLVKFLVNYVAIHQFDGETQKALLDITEQPISPELLPSDGKTVTQDTEQSIGPYELQDFFLYHFVRFGFAPEKIKFLANIAWSHKYDNDTIRKWLILFFKRFFTNQWKRDCVPAGVKVGSIDLSPRGSWRMPAEADLVEYLRNI